MTRCGIVDIKTSKSIQPKHWLQVAKYLWLKQKKMGIPFLSIPSFIAILRLDKLTGNYEYVEITDPVVIQEQVAVFDAFYTTYQHGQRIRSVMRQLAEKELLDAA